MVILIWDALCDLVLFVQYRKGEKYPWKGVNFSKVAGCKISTPPWVLFMFFKLYKWYQMVPNAPHLRIERVHKYGATKSSAT